MQTELLIRSPDQDIQSWDQTIHLQTIKFYMHVALKIVQSCDNIVENVIIITAVLIISPWQVLP